MKCFMVFVILTASISSCMQAEALFCSRTRRNAVKDRKKLWPEATIVYAIEKNFSLSELLVIRKAMNDIRSVSCIQFRKRTNEKAYVEIFKGAGCFSVVGYTGRRQPLSLGSGCFKVKTAIHELFHTLGFYHEHSRPDRDNFITVVEKNIKPEKIENFNKMSFSDVTTLGLTYDYNSVMHYHGKSFSKNQGKTLKAKLIDNDLKEVDSDVTTLDGMYDYNAVMHYHCKTSSKNQAKTVKAKLIGNDLKGGN